jgi:hypothetical protein
MSRSSKSEALARQSTAIATRPVDIEAILLKAAESNMSLEGVERLMALRKELKEEAAREAYFAALSAFQAACPAIQKTRPVYEKNKPHTPENVRYYFAALEDIEEAIKPYCKKYNFSYSFRARVDAENKQVETLCLINHIAGHTEASPFATPIDPKAFMSEAQKGASASSFSKRYALVNGFGLKLVGEDDDGGNPRNEAGDFEEAGPKTEPAERQRRQSTSQPQSKSGNNGPGKQINGEKINDAQVGVLRAQMDRAGLKDGDFYKRFNLMSLKDVTVGQMNEVLGWIRDPQNK